jgi:glycosyltransferase involved in cell wall biosynthesis
MDSLSYSVMRVSIVIPAYNEIATIAELVRRVEAVPIDKQIVLIDNLSTDGTREWIADYPGEATRILHERNEGKGASVRDGLAAATGDVAVIQDADLEYDPAQIPELVAPIESGEAQVVFGSRILGDNTVAHRSFGLGSRVLTAAVNTMFGGKLTDAATCYKVMHRSVYDSLPLVGNGFDLDFELAARIVHGGYRIREVPIRYDPRSLAEGKKIRPIDGLAGTSTSAAWSARSLEAKASAACSSPCTTNVRRGTPPSAANQPSSPSRSAWAENPSIVSIDARTACQSPKIRTGSVPS